MTAVMLLHTRTVDQLASKHLVLRQLELPLLRALAPRHLASLAKKKAPPLHRPAQGRSATPRMVMLLHTTRRQPLLTVVMSLATLTRRQLLFLFHQAWSLIGLSS